MGLVQGHPISEGGEGGHRVHPVVSLWLGWGHRVKRGPIDIPEL